jgi:hypothetical protein
VCVVCVCVCINISYNIYVWTGEQLYNWGLKQRGVVAFFTMWTLTCAQVLPKPLTKLLTKLTFHHVDPHLHRPSRSGSTSSAA